MPFGRLPGDFSTASTNLNSCTMETPFPEYRLNVAGLVDTAVLILAMLFLRSLAVGPLQLYAARNEPISTILPDVFSRTTTRCPAAVANIQSRRLAPPCSMTLQGVGSFWSYTDRRRLLPQHPILTVPRPQQPIYITKEV